MAQPMNSEDPWVPADTFGARLALVRQRKGWNTTQAANACGLNDQSWRNWEAGMSPRGMDRVARTIADVAGCDYSWLMAGGPLRSRCFTAIDGELGQMALFDESGVEWSHKPRLNIVR